jgi:hypothetical protein
MNQGLRTIRQHWAIALILTALFALGIAYTVVTPLFEKPDEIWHYPYVKWLADGQGLPVQDLARTQSLMKQEGTQPPLYYATAALATFWIEDDDWQDLVWLNPFWGYNAPGTVNDNKNRIFHTDRERFPYRGAVLAIRIARLVSVIWGGITVLATYLMALELSKGAEEQGNRGAREQGSSHLFPKERVFAAGAAALVAFNPQFIFIASAVSNDSTVSALCTLSLWLMLRLLRRGVSMPRLAWLGLTVGLALLAKTSALALLPVAVVAIAIAAWSKRTLQTSEVSQSNFIKQVVCNSSNDLATEKSSPGPRRSNHKGWVFLKGCIIVFGIVAIIAGWWYILNWRLHGDPLGLRVHQEIVGPGRPRLTLAELIHELSQIELSFWAAFGWGNVHAPSWIYTILRVAVRLGVLGLLIMAISELIKPKLEKAIRPGLALLLLWGLLVFAALLRWLQWIFAPSGRHLFPAISSFATLLLLGLLQLVPGCLRGMATALLAGTMLVFASICPPAYIVPAYARPPLLSEAAIEAVPNHLDVNFGGVMKLLGYDLPVANTQYPISNSIKPGDSLTITLYWQSLAKRTQDYTVFIHLLDENNLILAERNTFPGLGSFPTTLWQVGDAIADTYTLVLPETTYAPSSAQLEVGLFDFATGERLPVYGPEGEVVDDNVRFQEIEVLPRSEAGLPNPVHFNFGDKIALVGYEMDREKAEPGEAIHLTLYWQGLAEMKDDYIVFVHLLREGDQIWARADRQPQEGAAPTSTWSTGQVVVDEYELVTPPDAPPDVYEIEVGLYLAKTGERLDILDQDGRLMGNRVLLSKVRME